MSESDERREAERLANKYAATKGIAHGKRTEPAWMYTVKDFTAGYLAGRESMRAEVEELQARLLCNQSQNAIEGYEMAKQSSRLDDQLQAERERSATLVEVLRSVEWGSRESVQYGGFIKSCPSCGGVWPASKDAHCFIDSAQGHKPMCGLAEAIAEHKANR